MASGTLGIWLRSMSTEVRSLGGFSGTWGLVLGEPGEPGDDKASLEMGEAAAEIGGPPAVLRGGMVARGGKLRGWTGRTPDLRLSSLMICLIFSNVSYEDDRWSKMRLQRWLLEPTL